jgi:hypothetical protein
LTMLAIDPSRRRWIARYALTLAALMALACLAYLRPASFRAPPFDFSTLKRGESFDVFAMTRRQEGSVKLGFAEAYPPPEIGVYGNHIIQYFGGEAFGRREEPAYFFNYWYANLSLPEILSYLRLVEQVGHLPKKLLLVQITPPNADNGRFIVSWGSELPPDVALNSFECRMFSQCIWEFGAHVWQFVANNMHEVLNYNTFILGLVQRGEYGDRVISSSACQSVKPAWWRGLPRKFETLIGGRDYFCQRWTWRGALRRDGSVDAAFRENGWDAGQNDPLVKNEDPLRDAERGINAGDELEIARQIRAIDAIGRRHGIEVVFIVPPVYEADRRNSIVNKVFNLALALVPDITIIDHRSLHDDPALFKDSLHPSPAYYRIVVDELRRRGLSE